MFIKVTFLWQKTGKRDALNADFGGDKMGPSGRSPEVQMQELRERVHVQKEGHSEDKQVRFHR